VPSHEDLGCREREPEAQALAPGRLLDADRNRERQDVEPNSKGDADYAQSGFHRPHFKN
jgi:hypothetical protein